MAAEIRALTGVRGVGAVTIAIYHYGKIRLDWAHDVWPIPHGYIVVDLFFMLSGYVLALNYKDAFSNQPLRTYLTFLIRRFAHLYPPYAVISVLYILQLALHWAGEPTLARFGLYDIIGNALMLNGWGLGFYPLIGVSWAAGAELASYILLPALLFCTIWRGPVWWGVSVGVAIFAIYMVGTSGIGVSGPLDVVNAYSPLPLVRAVAGFTLGLAIFRYADHLDSVSPKRQDVLLLIVLAAMIAAALLTRNDFPIYALFIPLVAILSRDGPLAKLLFANRLIFHLGVISYSIYLLHPLFVRPAALLARRFGASELAYSLSTMFFFLVIWALSYLIYLFVEEPGRRLVGRVLVRKPHLPPAAAEAAGSLPDQPSVGGTTGPAPRTLT